MVSNKETLIDDITIYPNMTTGLLFIDSSNSPFEGGLRDVIITDLLGREVTTSACHDLDITNAPNKNKIDVSILPQGIYFLQINTPDNQTLSEKIIKQ